MASVAKQDNLGCVVRWWEFICGGCGKSEVQGPTYRAALTLVKDLGWKKMRSPAGYLWMCGYCVGCAGGGPR